MSCFGRVTRRKGNNVAYDDSRAIALEKEKSNDDDEEASLSPSHLGTARRAKQQRAGEQRRRSSCVGSSHWQREERELGGQKKGN